MIENLEKKTGSYGKKIADYMDSRIAGYRESFCYRSLRNRITRLKDSYDMRIRSTNSTRSVNNWKSKVVYPLVRETMLIRRAVLLQAFRPDPLITVRPGEGNTELSARKATGTLQSNLRNQRFREDAFHKIINSVAKYGTGMVCSYPNYSESMVMKTVPQLIGGYDVGMYQRTLVPRQRFGIAAKAIHPLNYWQNDHMVDPESSDFRGYTDRVQISDLMSLAKQNEVYNKSAVEKVIAEASKASKTDANYYQEAHTNDMTMFAVDVDYWWGYLHIKGNETDDTLYYVEKAGGHILRIEPNPIDEGITPLDNFYIDKRDDFWWGNTDAESVVSYENYLTMWMQMTADAGLRAMQQYVFYNKALGIDPAMLNERAKSGGFIPVNLKAGSGNDFRNMFYQASFQDPSIGPMNAVAARMMEAADRVVPRKDFTRTEQAGGPKNSTATAAVIADQEGDVQDNYYLNDFSYGLQSFGRTQLTLLQQHLPGVFKIRPNPTDVAQRLQKSEILGYFDFYTQSALSINKQVKAQNLLNLMTAIQNFKGAGVDPTWMNVNIGDIAREWFRSIDIGVDLDRIMPEDMPQSIPQQLPMPGMQAQAPGVGAMPPSPPPVITAGGPQPAAGNL